MEPGRRPRTRRQGPLTGRAGALAAAADAADEARRELEATVEETLAALVVAADGWPALDGAGRPPSPLDRDRVAALAARLPGSLERALRQPHLHGALHDPHLLGALHDPHLLGAVHERAHDASHRRRRGVHLTPPDVCAGMLALAVDDWPDPAGPRRVLDPACGGGAFLVEAARRLGPRVELVGVDLDPRAAWCTRLALRSHPGPVRVTVADTLARAPHELGPIDLVVGNPPFSAQLRRVTARDGDGRANARERFGDLLGPYADGALGFLLDALDRVDGRGRVALILPWSVLASRDARVVRSRLARSLRHLWLGGPGVFPGALVQVCGVVVDASPSSPTVDLGRSWGPGFEPLEPAPRTDEVTAGEWGALLADALGVPDLSPGLLAAWSSGPTIGDLATVTAGFRDEFYAVTAAVVDLGPTGEASTGREAVPAGVGPDEHPVVSVGMIEPLASVWGRRPARMGGRTVVRPVVRLSDLAADDRAARWVRSRLVPKVLVATQTKVVEATVDEAGTAVPLTPVVSVEPRDPSRLWHLAAALTGPVATVLAWRRAAGTALSAGAVKVSATVVRTLPVPTDAAAWDRAADIARRVATDPTPAGWRELAVAHDAAFGVDDGRLVDWWLDRMGASGGHVDR